MYDCPLSEQPWFLLPAVNVMPNPVTIVKQQVTQIAQRLGSGEFRAARDLLYRELQRTKDSVNQLCGQIAEKDTASSWTRARKLPVELQKFKDGYDQVIQKIDRANEVAQKPVDAAKSEAFFKRQLKLLLDRGAKISQDGISLITDRDVILRASPDSEAFNFGRLQMLIRWHAIGSSPFDETWIKVTYYEGGDDDVLAYENCHPHVWNDGRVCLGREGDDGPFVSIRQALLAGDLMFVFDLLEATLHTYNKDSPIRPLQDWTGDSEAHTCGRCGDSDVLEDDLYLCGYCDMRVCNECSEYSEIEDRVLCNECIGDRCNSCDEPVSPCTALHYCECCETDRCEACWDAEPCSSCDECSTGICGDAIRSDPMGRHDVVCEDCANERQERMANA